MLFCASRKSAGFRVRFTGLVALLKFLSGPKTTPVVARRGACREPRVAQREREGGERERQGGRAHTSEPTLIASSDTPLEGAAHRAPSGRQRERGRERERILLLSLCVSRSNAPFVDTL